MLRDWMASVSSADATTTASAVPRSGESQRCLSVFTRLRARAGSTKKWKGGRKRVWFLKFCVGCAKGDLLWR